MPDFYPGPQVEAITFCLAHPDLETARESHNLAGSLHASQSHYQHHHHVSPACEQLLLVLLPGRQVIGKRQTGNSGSGFRRSEDSGRACQGARIQLVHRIHSHIIHRIHGHVIILGGLDQCQPFSGGVCPAAPRDLKSVFRIDMQESLEVHEAFSTRREPHDHESLTLQVRNHARKIQNGGPSHHPKLFPGSPKKPRSRQLPRQSCLRRATNSVASQLASPATSLTQNEIAGSR